MKTADELKISLDVTIPAGTTRADGAMVAAIGSVRAKARQKVLMRGRVVPIKLRPVHNVGFVIDNFVLASIRASLDISPELEATGEPIEMLDDLIPFREAVAVVVRPRDVPDFQELAKKVTFMSPAARKRLATRKLDPRRDDTPETTSCFFLQFKLTSDPEHFIEVAVRDGKHVYAGRD